MTQLIRVSVGTAGVLGLCRIRMLEAPTTAYLMLYHTGKCSAQCSFCAQALNSSTSSEYLSRVTWPAYSLEEVLSLLSKCSAFKRICIQTLVYSGMITDLSRIIMQVTRRVEVPVSVSINPSSIRDLKILREMGVERVGIGLDAASKEVFKRVKKPFSWDLTLRLIRNAAEIFGRGSVTCHLIYGLGDSDEDFLRTVHQLHEMGVYTSLFAFTPVKGAALERLPPPSPRSYRAIQLAHYLITCGLITIEDLVFDRGVLVDINVAPQTLKRVVESCKPFVTRGCPGCNRPFFNESPRGPIYNYPSLQWAKRDIKLIRLQLKQVLGGFS